MLSANPTSRARRGFTMVELLVAMAISSFLVVTIFFIMTSSSRTFRLQNDVSQVSDRLSYAMDTIKNDLRRASFMTVPNAYLPQEQYPWYRQVCAPPPWMASPNGTTAAAHAIWVREGSGGGSVMDYYDPAVDDQVMPGTRPDQLIILGSFRATEPFRPTAMASGSVAITVPNGDYSPEQMENIFEDAWISVSTPAGGMQFLSIDDAVPSATLPETELQLNQPLQPDPTGTGLEACNFTGFGGATFEVVPLHFVRYSLVRDPDDMESVVLVREELDANMQALDIATRYVVARDLVDFQVWFDGVEAGSPATEVKRDGEGSGVWTDDSGAMNLGLLNGNALAEPENARFGYIQISGRLDTGVTRTPPPAGALREFVELIDCTSPTECTPSGEFTRVQTIRSEVELPNLTLANTRTLP